MQHKRSGSLCGGRIDWSAHNFRPPAEQCWGVASLAEVVSCVPAALHWRLAVRARLCPCVAAFFLALATAPADNAAQPLARAPFLSTTSLQTRLRPPANFLAAACALGDSKRLRTLRIYAALLGTGRFASNSAKSLRRSYAASTPRTSPLDLDPGLPPARATGARRFRKPPCWHQQTRSLRCRTRRSTACPAGLGRASG